MTTADQPGRESESGPPAPGPSRHRHVLDVPLLAIAILAATVIGFFVGQYVEEDRCLDAGGRLVVSGADHVCQLPDGGAVVIRVLPSAFPSMLVAGGMLCASIWLLYWLMWRLVRRRS